MREVFGNEPAERRTEGMEKCLGPGMPELPEAGSLAAGRNRDPHLRQTGTKDGFARS